MSSFDTTIKETPRLHLVVGGETGDLPPAVALAIAERSPDDAITSYLAWERSEIGRVIGGRPAVSQPCWHDVCGTSRFVYTVVYDRVHEESVGGWMPAHLRKAGWSYCPATSSNAIPAEQAIMYVGSRLACSRNRSGKLRWAP